MPPQPVPCFYPPYRVHRPACQLRQHAVCMRFTVRKQCHWPRLYQATMTTAHPARPQTSLRPRNASRATSTASTSPVLRHRPGRHWLRSLPQRSRRHWPRRPAVRLQGLTCEPGMAHSKGDCEDEAQKFLRRCLRSGSRPARAALIEPNVCISAHMIRCVYNESERKHYHTLAALLCQDPNRSTCELRLVECTCADYLGRANRLVFASASTRNGRATTTCIQC